MSDDEMRVKYSAYISSEDMPIRRIPRSDLSFGVLDGWININQREHIKIVTKVNVGEMYMIFCKGRHLEVAKMAAPQRRADFLMWLLSFGKSCRAYTEVTYQQLLERQKLAHAWWDYADWSLRGEGYAFTVCNTFDPRKILHIAAYVDESVRQVDAEMMLEILKLWQYPLTLPRLYVERLLKRRFGFSKDLMEEICKLNSSLFPADWYV